jgi:putative NIF3 family GTP cyclohydrolase 1 type 2
MKAVELNNYLVSLKINEKISNDILAKYNILEVDRVIYGDPNREIEGIAVCWMPYIETIHKARELGANVIVAHEPTFYDHWDLDGSFHDSAAIEEKKRIIDECQITIIRCHDVWDVFPDHGILAAWADFLGLDDAIKIVNPFGIYKIEKQEAIVYAEEVLRKISTLGQECVSFCGDPNKIVNTVGIGVGCNSDPFKMYQLGADFAIAVDDISRAWIIGEWSRDTGNPALIVEHSISEEPGQASLAVYLKEQFPDFNVHYIQQGYSYKKIHISQIKKRS